MSSDYRYEIKFVLDNSRTSDALQWINGNTSANKVYENRVVNSLYFDDVGLSSVRDNLAGISQRNKKRLRWYSNQKNNSPMFEVKTKNGRLGCKTTYPINSINDNLITLSLDKITSHCVQDLAMQGIILDEYLLPTLQVSYEREYFMDHDGIRITIDRDIQFSDAQLHTTLYRDNPISYPFSVMEIKFNPSLKNRASKLMKPLHMAPKRHSKYLIGLAMLGYVVYI